MSYAPAHIDLMLRAIREKADVSRLLAAGLSYSQIAKLVARVRELGYVESKALVLTEAGHRLLDGQSDGRAQLHSKIQPAERYRIPATDAWAIFLPEFEPGLRLARPIGDTRDYIGPLASGG
jgi:hypothetical protein